MRLVPERNAQCGSDPGIIEVDSILLRDFFAAMALQGILGSGDHVDGTGDEVRHSDLAYRYADAMLERRNKF